MAPSYHYVHKCKDHLGINKNIESYYTSDKIDLVDQETNRRTNDVGHQKA